MKSTVTGFNFENTYLELNTNMYSIINLKNNYVSNIKIFNDRLAKELDLKLEYLKSEEGIKILSGCFNNDIKSGFSQVYSGHQFGHFTNLDRKSVV